METESALLLRKALRGHALVKARGSCIYKGLNQ